jgi:hypothetical protein
VFDLACAGLGTVVVLVVPGWLIAWSLRFPFRSLLTWAAVPVFSLAAVFVLGEVTDVAGLPFGVPAFVVFVVALGATACVLRLYRRETLDIGEDYVSPAGERTADRHDTTLQRQVAYGLLAFGVAIGAITWALGVKGAALGPPKIDGSNHGYLVARVVDTESVDPAKVLVIDPRKPRRAASYYPLGMHASAAIAKRLVDADIGRVLMAFVVVFGSVVFPIGMFVLARLLAPQQPLVAGFTAMVVPTLLIFPYYPSTSGAITSLLGMAMVPVSVVLMTRALTTTTRPLGDAVRLVISLIPAALALVTATAVHNTELTVILFLVGLLVLENAWRLRSAKALLYAFVRGVLATFLAAILFAPSLTHLGPGYSERSSITLAPNTSFDEAIGPILALRSPISPGQAALAALAVVGGCMWLLIRRRPAWALGWVTVIAVAVLANASTGVISRALSLPWYRHVDRINANQAFFVPFFASVVLAFAVTGAVRVLKSRRWIVPASVIAVAAFMALVGLHALRTARERLHDAYQANLGLKPASQQAYDFLQQHARDSDRIVNQHPRTDGSLWMYAEAGLNPLFGLALFDYPVRDYDHRQVLKLHIAQVGINPNVDELARSYHARWIYVDDQAIARAAKRLVLKSTMLNVEALRRNPRIHEVFRRGTIHVFKIDNL